MTEYKKYSDIKMNREQFKKSIKQWNKEHMNEKHYHKVKNLKLYLLSNNKMAQIYECDICSQKIIIQELDTNINNNGVK